MSLFSKVAFYPTLVYNIFLTKVTSRKWYNRIDETVILGALPLKSWTQILVEEENVRGIVSTTEEFETKQLVNTEEEWRELGVEQLKIPTVDFTGTPSQEQITKAVTFIMRQRNEKNSVYVHCKAGRTRSATIVACYLMQTKGMKPDEAVDFIKTKRPHIWLREKQLDSIQFYYKVLNIQRQAAVGGS